MYSSVRSARICGGALTGGNQRDMDRAKAQKKAAANAKNKPKESAASLQKRREQCVRPRVVSCPRPPN